MILAISSILATEDDLRGLRAAPRRGGHGGHAGASKNVPCSKPLGQLADNLAVAALLTPEERGLEVILRWATAWSATAGRTPSVCEIPDNYHESERLRVAVHLGHAEDQGPTRQAVNLGFGSVMFDGATLDKDANVAATRWVEYAHGNDVYVEAELGEIGGKNGAHAPGARTNPQEAGRFVSDTGVDALAVAGGSSHAMTEHVASIDLELIARLHAELAVPFVLHGSSGVSDNQIVQAIRAGMTKINVFAHLNGFFTAAVRNYLREYPAVVDSRKYVQLGREALAAEAGRMIALFSGAYEGEQQ